MLNKIIIPLLLLICVYGAGYMTALKNVKPPPAPASVSASASSEVETVKETFNCPNGALSSRESTKKIDTSKSEIKAPPVIPPDNLLFDGGSNLQVGVMYDLPDLPLIPPHTWVGYAKDVRTGENIYKLGYSTRIF